MSEVQSWSKIPRKFKKRTKKPPSPHSNVVEEVF